PRQPRAYRYRAASAALVAADSRGRRAARRAECGRRRADQGGTGRGARGVWRIRGCIFGAALAAARIADRGRGGQCAAVRFLPPRAGDVLRRCRRRVPPALLPVQLGGLRLVLDRGAIAARPEIEEPGQRADEEIAQAVLEEVRKDELGERLLLSVRL